MSNTIQRADFGRVTVFFGDKTGKYPDGNQVVVRGTDTRFAFDTPQVANRIGPEFDATECVILGHVHEDHMAGLHRLPRARVQAHERDLEAARSWEGLSRHYGYSPEVLASMRVKIEREFNYVPRPDATGYTDGTVWEAGGARIRAIHMPGHTSGHSVLLVESEGVAFIGDIDLTGFGPYYGDATSNLAEFRQSLARIADVPAKVWVTSHHRGVYTDRAEFLKGLAAFAAKIDERERRLCDMLRASPKTIGELVAERLMYPVDYTELWVSDVERKAILQHLEELLRDGRVSLEADGRYRLA